MIKEIDLDVKSQVIPYDDGIYIVNIRKCHIPTLEELSQAIDYQKMADKKGFYSQL